MVKTSVCICIVMMFCGQFLFAQPAQSADILKKFDKNHDNRISFAEAPNRMQENFHRHDMNRDGYIKGEELSTLPPPKGSSNRPSHPSGPPPERSGNRPKNASGPPPRR